MKPMLASEAGTLPTTPVLASPKIDGVRCLIVDGVAMSRSMKPIRNKYVQRILGRPELNGLDGELVVGAPTGQDVMQRTTSGVMSSAGEPDFTYWVFDLHDRSPEVPFCRRIECVEARFLDALDHIRVLKHVPLIGPHDIGTYEQTCIDQGYEGIMLRDPQGPYKHGRSTLKEGWLLKVKRWSDGEGTVIGFEERQHNHNEATTNELGRTKRSTHAAGKVPAGDLGALTLELPDGQTLSVGGGFTAAQRVGFWSLRDTLLGKLCKFKHFAQAGVVDLPRFPIFQGFRDPDDL